MDVTFIQARRAAHYHHQLTQIACRRHDESPARSAEQRNERELRHNTAKTDRTDDQRSLSLSPGVS